MTKKGDEPLPFGVWLATEGGRRCPQCGRYAKPEQLGHIGGWFRDGRAIGDITMYGHLPGFGCNKIHRYAELQETT